MSEVNAISLFELNQLIKDGIKQFTQPSYWIIAEISEISVNSRGHCYMELIEKPESSSEIIAKSRAIIWNNTFRMLKPYFETTTNQAFEEGIKIFVKVSVEFHELYGFSLNIKDIDPNYTLGDLARQKQLIINKLLQEGVFEMNKQVELPLLPKRIAVISSQKAAGYHDFIQQLENNSFNYSFTTQLFTAVMQGKETEESIIEALEKIYHYEDKFDVVVIIRGGGSQSDLNSFNSYWLAYHITQFPLPVLTGIGHEKDDTILDLVAHTRLKTPTAVAEFLIDIFNQNEQQLYDLSDQINAAINDKLDLYAEKLLNLTLSIKSLVQNKLHKEQLRLFRNLNLKPIINQHINARETYLENKLLSCQIITRNTTKQKELQLENWLEKLKINTRQNLKLKARELDNLEKKNAYINPLNVLKRGYSITHLNGKTIRSVKEVKKGDIITTLLADGNIQSKVEKK